jgi:hypothetical protein
MVLAICDGERHSVPATGRDGASRRWEPLPRAGLLEPERTCIVATAAMATVDFA